MASTSLDVFRGRRRGRMEQLEQRRLLAADPLLLADAPQASAIHGNVYFAADTEASPTAVAGVQIELLDREGQMVAGAATDAAGSFAFENLEPGTYALRELQPDSLADGWMTLGDGGGQLLSDNLIAEIELAAGQIAAGYAFVETPAGIGGGSDPPPLTTHGDAAAMPANVILQLEPSATELRGEPALAVVARSDGASTQETPEGGSSLVASDGESAVDPANISVGAPRVRAQADANLLEQVFSQDPLSDGVDQGEGSAQWLEQWFGRVFQWPWTQPAEAAEQSEPAARQAQSEPPRDAATRLPRAEAPVEVVESPDDVPPPAESPEVASASAAGPGEPQG